MSEIDWAKYGATGLISSECVELLDKESYKDTFDTLTLEASRENCALLVGAIKTIAKPDAISYILTLLYEYCTEESEDIAFTRAERMDLLLGDDPLAVITVIASTQQVTTAISQGNDSITSVINYELAAHLLVHIMLNEKPESELHANAMKEARKYVTAWTEVNTSDKGTFLAYVHAMGIIFTVRELRKVFIDHGGVEKTLAWLAAAEKHDVTTLTYRVVYVIWLLTFHDHARPQFLKHDAVPALLGLLLESKEKVVRISMLALRNLLQDKAGVITAVASCIDQYLEPMRVRSYADPDIIESIAVVTKTVSDAVATLSTWSAYKEEVASGTLKRTPVHESTMFWKQNAHRLADNGADTMNRVAAVIIESTDPVSIAVGCSDLAHFLDGYDGARTLVESVPGLRARLLHLVAASDKTIVAAALRLLQRLIVGPTHLALGDL
ncbi:ATPase V1 complex subunit H [Carpediemonas membranifera]|uniref:ATPase V1 complex subunit H n=1 Tax=Carpediemonas membranifera TaxID=201153 RepID=A0A8J6DZ23_9EUKA|nr:ATPase V1 complex subunit H [Carpediemonas membranifera]|eukprot:KAG9390143.1 ATPase V1 complex subunit H [Carpediemonas membranifera]